MATFGGPWQSFDDRDQDWTDGDTRFNWASRAGPDNVWKAIIVDIALTKATPNPRYHSSGATNLLTSEVAAGSTYVLGGVTLTPSKQDHPSIAGRAICTYGDTDILWSPADAGGFNDGVHVVIYNDTDPQKRAWFFFTPSPSTLLSIQNDTIQVLPDPTNGLFQDFTV